MGQRFVAAFSQYKMSIKDAEAFKKLVDKNGMPVFVKAGVSAAQVRRADPASRRTG